jgi:hypothetical protein
MKEVSEMVIGSNMKENLPSKEKRKVKYIDKTSAKIWKFIYHHFENISLTCLYESLLKNII